MKDYSYTYQKFTQAIECLSTGEGDIRERLKDAYIYYLIILRHDNDFPDFLKKDRNFIQKNMTKFEAKGDMKYFLGLNKNGENIFKGSIEVTMSKIKRKTGKKIAEKIFHIWEQLHEIKFG